MKIGAAFGAQPFAKATQRAPQGGFKGQRTEQGMYISGTGLDKSANTIPEALKEKIREQARKDAPTGVYMSKEFTALEHGYMKQHISPDRGRAISQMSSFMNRISAANQQGSILDLFGMPYTGKVHHGLTKTTASVFNEYGEMIAAYHSDSGWQPVGTQAEDQYMWETTRVYEAAFREARQEIQSAQGGGGSVDFRA